MITTILTINMVRLSACDSTEEPYRVEHPELQPVLEKEPNVYWTNQTDGE